MASGPLDGVRVLDFTQIIAGPLGCMLLSDLGAEVVKIEPVGGEPWRLTAQFFPHESKAYQSLNRGKQSVAIDLYDDRAKTIVSKLIAGADVMVINYRPDVSARLGIDYDSVTKIKPDIVYVDSTAFGRKGPWAHRPGYDIVAQAASGLMMVRGGTLDDRGHPLLTGQGAPADFTTGYAIAWAACAGLFSRERTGKGQKVETSLLVNALVLQGSTFMSNPAADAEARASFLADLEQSRESGEPFPQFVERRKKAAPVVSGAGVYYRGYLTRNGALAVGCLSPAVRQRFRAAVGFEDPNESADGVPQRTVNTALQLEVEGILQGKTTEEWMVLFDKHSVPAGPVRYVEELAEDEQVLANSYAVDLDHDLTGPQRMTAPPLQMSGTPTAPQGAAPPLGRDTRKWLREVGMTDEQIEAMVADGAAYMGLAAE
ncbi:MAG: CoA transferase [Dehalococcoidia bacterium]|nr:CoA transferase [Dehalococcoidia bacterium]